MPYSLLLLLLLFVSIEAQAVNAASMDVAASFPNQKVTGGVGIARALTGGSVSGLPEVKLGKTLMDSKNIGNTFVLPSVEALAKLKEHTLEVHIRMTDRLRSGVVSLNSDPSLYNFLLELKKLTSIVLNSKDYAIGPQLRICVEYANAFLAAQLDPKIFQKTDVGLGAAYINLLAGYMPRQGSDDGPQG